MKDHQAHCRSLPSTDTTTRLVVSTKTLLWRPIADFVGSNSTIPRGCLYLVQQTQRVWMEGIVLVMNTRAWSRSTPTDRPHFFSVHDEHKFLNEQQLCISYSLYHDRTRCFTCCIDPYGVHRSCCNLYNGHPGHERP